MKFVKVIFSLFFIVILCLGGFFLYKYQDAFYIDRQIAENGWDETIRSQSTTYDFQLGEFFKVITYEDHAGYKYNYRVCKHPETKERIIATFVFDGADMDVTEQLSHPYIFPYEE